MKNLLCVVLAGLVLAVFCASEVPAQSDPLRAAAGDKYLISAKAGGIGYTEGRVTLSDATGRMTRLVKGNYVEVGERVATGTEGRVEVLLNPGSYLRLGSNSEFKFDNTSLDDLRLTVLRGAAILEVFAGDDFKVTVKTPGTSFALVRSGVYRVDTRADGSASLEVWKGQARAGATGEKVKPGQTVSFANGSFAVAKFDRDERDPLDEWSRTRAREAAKLIGQLERGTMRNSLLNSYIGGRWSVYDSFGLWVYSSLTGRYCFLPFGYGWESPYGFGYGTWLGWFNMPPVVYTPPPGVAQNTPPPTIKVNQGSIPPSGGDQQIPPFVKMDGGIRGGIRPPQDSDTRIRTVEPAPVFVPPAMPPPGDTKVTPNKQP